VKNRIFLLLLFFGSGACGLLFEVVWTRRLTLLFGATVYAVASVLAIYMAGLAAGSFLFSRLAERSAKPGRLLSLVLAGAGVSGAAVLPALDLIQPVYLSWIGSTGWDSLSAGAGRLLVSALVLIIPCTLQGGTFPLMGRVYAGLTPEAGRNAAHIYAVNTFGAVFGGLFTGFFAIPRCGLSASSAAGGAGYLILGVACGLSAGFFARRVSGDAPSPVEDGDAAPEYATQSDPSAAISLRLVAVAALLSGMTALAYEVVWTRILQVFLRNSPYTFAVILASFLSGIALGSLLAARIAPGHRRALRLFALFQSCIALIAIVLQPLFGMLPDLLRPLSGVTRFPSLTLFLPGLVMAFAVVLIPATLMGLSFPLLCRAYVESSGGRLAYGLGRVYGLNTMGAIAGSLGAGFVLIPLAGTSGSNLLVALVNLALAAVIMHRIKSIRAPLPAEKQGGRKRAGKEKQAVKSKQRAVWAWLAMLAAADISLLLLGVGSPARTILPPSVHRTKVRQDRVLYYRETAPGTVVVVEDGRSGLRSCFVNNNVVCGTSYDALKVIRMLGHLPMILRGTDEPCRSLVIGFGTGVTSASLLRYPWQERLDCVEICPGVLEAALFFRDVNHTAYKDPRLRFIPGDGRSYVDACRETYDVISCDPTHPALGCGSLYSTEYFLSCRRILTDGGIICQYLPFHKMSERHFRAALATFREVFPRMNVWVGFSHAIMVGRAGETEQAIDVDFIARVMTLPEVREDLYAVHLETPYDLLSTFALGEKGVESLINGEVLRNTDDHPVLEYSGPEALRPDAWPRNMEQLLRHMDSPLPYLRGPGPAGPPRTVFLPALQRYLGGKHQLYLGQIAWHRGQLGEALDHFRQGLRINPEDMELSDLADLAMAGLKRGAPPPFSTE